MKIENIVFIVSNQHNKIVPLFRNIPVGLMSLGNISPIESAIINFRNLDYKKIKIVCGYKSNLFNFLKEKYDVEIVVNPEYKNMDNDIWYFGTVTHPENTLYIREFMILDKLDDVATIIKRIDKKNTSLFFSNFENDTIFNSSKFEEAFNGIFYVTKQTHKLISDKIRKAPFSEKKKASFTQIIYKMNNLFTNVYIPKLNIRKLLVSEDFLMFQPNLSKRVKLTLFTPGAGNINQECANVLTEVSIYHRSQFFATYFKEIIKLLKELFQTEEGSPIVISATATGIQEATIVNMLEKGDKVLIIVAGHFSSRFNDILTSFGCDVDVLHYSNGKTYNISDVNEKLANNKYKALITTHHETSTGVLHEINKLSESIQEFSPETLFIVDSVSSVVDHDVEFDKNKIDVAFATSGKGFSVLPGLSFVCLSNRALEVSRKNTNFKYYFDFNKYVEYSKNNSTPFTISTAILLTIYSFLLTMKFSTKKFEREEKQKIYSYLNHQLTDLGFENAVSPNNRTIGLLVVKTPNNLDATSFRNLLEYEEGQYMELTKIDENGNGPYLRIGISNSINLDDAKMLVRSIAKHLKRNY